jgi:hypothetical protein
MQKIMQTSLAQAGDANLTHPGNSHGLQQTDKEDLMVIINDPVK